MRFLHTSDWHFGRFMKNTGDLEKEQRFFIDQICHIIEEKNIDAVLLAGDVYDRAMASSDTVKLYDEAITDLIIRHRTPVLMVAGNHDGAARLAVCNRILEAGGLHICGILSRKIHKVEFDDTDVYLLPWFTAEKVRALFPEDEEKITDLTLAYQYVCDRIRADFAPEKKHILVAHAFIVNAETSTSDRSAEIGLAAAVSAGVFEGFDYVALGHIHKPQAISETIRYSGTPMPYSFGKEENQQKSVVIIDTEAMNIETVPLKLLHPLKTIEGTLGEIQNMEVTEELAGSYIRIRVTDAFLDGETRLRLEKKFPLMVEAAGKLFDDENAGITLTREELEELENDPVEIFRKFCEDETSGPADEHMISLFEEALKEYEKGDSLQ
ncbi:MAG: exonuclease SbcCD subunit D [Parasporobacterium sp.]|nr:exonuclease SbcCD subunit D [Parasporobacterium sp.]